MSIPVIRSTLPEQAEAFGPSAYLVSVGPDQRPHVVAVPVRWQDQAVVVPAGRTTRANVEQRGGVTLVWPAPSGSGYSLLLDGAARVLPGEHEPSLGIEPAKAVLHRTPEGDASDPSCITVFPRP